jgi:hypothetical protein
MEDELLNEANVESQLEGEPDLIRRMALRARNGGGRLVAQPWLIEFETPGGWTLQGWSVATDTSRRDAEHRPEP